MLKVNGKSYKEKEIDFNFVCELGNNGIQLDEISKKYIPALRCYVAYCMDSDLEEAGNEINDHVLKHGDLNEITSVFNDMVEKSGFFRALKTESEEETDNPEEDAKKSKA